MFVRRTSDEGPRKEGVVGVQEEGKEGLTMPHSVYMGASPICWEEEGVSRA